MKILRGINNGRIKYFRNYSKGLAQAAANAYDGAHDERFVRDGEAKKVGLKREEGCPIMDKRVMDGFNVKFYGNKICIKYQSEYPIKRNLHGGGLKQKWNAG